MEKNKLIEDNMKLVYYLVNKHYPTYLKNEDVIQEGMVGLCKAADTFDESKGKFVTFAGRCILNQIGIYFRTMNKQIGVMSLNKEVKNDDGDTVSFIEMLVGDEDVDFSYMDYKLFYDSLTEKEKQLLQLHLDHSQREIADILGVTPPTVSKTLKRIKFKWRKFYGSN